MTRTEKISAIYKEMANKEETFWCKVLVDNQKRVWHNLELESDIEDTIIGKIRDPNDFRKFNLEDNWPSYDDWQRSNIDEEEFTCITEVIWHPVMIGDVLDWIEPYWWVFAQSVNLDIERTRKGTLLLSVRKQKRKPIDDQSDECIDYVYSLISKGNE